jgi:ankyrin repeat protein
MKNESPHELEIIKRLKSQKLKVTDIISYIRIHEVDVNKLDRTGYNILHYAIRSDVPDVVNLFLNPSEEYKIKPADPNITTQDEAKNIFLPPMLLALLHSNDDSSSYKIIKFLLKVAFL